MKKYRKPTECPWCGEEGCGGDAWADGCDGIYAQERRSLGEPIPIDPKYKNK